MLKTRVITAVVMLAVLLPGVFLLPALAFSLLALVVACAAAWEFGRLAGQGPAGQKKFALVILMACAGIGSQLPGIVGFGASSAAEHAIMVFSLGFSAAFWLCLCPFWLRHRWRLPVRGWQPWMVGWIVIVPTWLAMISLRQTSAWVLLGAMAIAWVADIAAYFTGRRFGKRKLAPEISPGKTIAGAWGAIIAVLLYGGGLVVATDTSLSPLGWAGAAAFAVLITVVSIAGDLFESLLKRQADIKDSSNLLPGHGGVLDRIDSLTAVLPLVALSAYFI